MFPYFKGNWNNSLGNKCEIPPAHVKNQGNGSALLKVKKKKKKEEKETVWKDYGEVLIEDSVECKS